MDIRQLRYFLNVSTTQSFTKAAAITYTSRQAVSNAVRALEQELGVTLITSKDNHLTLTDEGVRFAQGAEAVVKQFDSLISNFSRRESSFEGHSLSIACTYTLLSYGFPGLSQLITQFGRDHEGTVFRLSEYSSKVCLEKVKSGEANLGIILTMGSIPTDVDATLIDRCPIGLVVRNDHPLYKRNTVTPADLDDVRLILLSDWGFIYQPLFLACAENNAIFNPTHVINDEKSMLELVKQTGDVGIDGLSKESNYPNNIRIVPFANDDFAFYNYLITQKNNKHSPILKELQNKICSSTDDIRRNA